MATAKRLPATTFVAWETPLGPIAVVETGKQLSAVRVGHFTLDDLIAAIEREFPIDDRRKSSPVSKRLDAYANGKSPRLGDIPLDYSGYTDFRRRVTEACRQIPFGEVRSYAQLAAEVDAPAAARAVGTVMRKNLWPIIVPCHRVLSSTGIGGYSAPRGLDFKRTLLAHEGHPLASA